MEQIWDNPFKNLSTTPYCMICASSGSHTAVFPDGTEMSVVDVKRDLNLTQLFAWNAERRDLLDWIEYFKLNPDYKGKIVIDSGAYSAWSRGKEFDVDEYIDFLHSSGSIDICFWAAEADVIPGTMGVDPTYEQILDAAEQSWSNYLYMVSKVKYPKKILPIFHQGEDFKYLVQMLEYTFEDGEHIPYIGISPRNDVHVNEKIKWYEKVWKIIKNSSNPNVLTHNFGMTTTSVIEQYPSFSSDSTSWIRGAAFGSIFILDNNKMKLVYVSDRDKNSNNHINNKNVTLRKYVDDMCKTIGHGLTLEALSQDPNGALRGIFNLYVINDWANNFKFKGNDLFKSELWF